MCADSSDPGIGKAADETAGSRAVCCRLWGVVSVEAWRSVAPAAARVADMADVPCVLESVE